MQSRGGRLRPFSLLFAFFSARSLLVIEAARPGVASERPPTGAARLSGCAVLVRKQYRSKLPSEPALTFATHGRETRAKLLCRMSTPHWTQGADSPALASNLARFGGQTGRDAQAGTPSACFTGDRRFREPGQARPGVGPQSYNMPQVVFRTTALSRIRSEPKIDFGRMDREKLAKATEPRFGRDSPAQRTPSPPLCGSQSVPRIEELPEFDHHGRRLARADLPAAQPRARWIKQLVATDDHTAAPTPPKSAVARVSSAKMFPGREIHAEMEKAMIGVEGPSRRPAVAPVTFGKQVTSKFATRPKSAFGRASRFGIREAVGAHPHPGRELMNTNWDLSILRAL